MHDRPGYKAKRNLAHNGWFVSISHTLFVIPYYWNGFFAESDIQNTYNRMHVYNFVWNIVCSGRMLLCVCVCACDIFDAG